MAANNARYFLSGHDHLFNRAIIKSPDGTASIQHIIHSSDSYKFYIPRIPSVDQTTTPAIARKHRSRKSCSRLATTS